MNSAEAHRQAIANLEAERLRFTEAIGRLQATLASAVAWFDSGERALCIKDLQRALDLAYEELGDTTLVEDLARRLGVLDELEAEDQAEFEGEAF